jgi:hypothetical protein
MTPQPLDHGDTSSAPLVPSAQPAAPLSPAPSATETPEIDPYIALRMRWADNRNNFPLEELARYGGKEVAWWPDGTRIVDADEDGNELTRRLLAAGYDLSFFVFERIDSPDESFV